MKMKKNILEKMRKAGQESSGVDLLKAIREEMIEMAGRMIDEKEKIEIFTKISAIQKNIESYSSKGKEDNEIDQFIDEMEELSKDLLN